MRKALEVVEVNDRQLDDVLRRVEAALDEQDATLVRRVFESYAYVTGVVLEDKDSAIRRLQQLFFGKRTEKTRLLVRRRGRERGDPGCGPSP